MAKETVMDQVPGNQPRSFVINQMPNPSNFLWGLQGLNFALKLTITAFFVVVMSLSDEWYTALLAVLAASYVGAYKLDVGDYRSFGLTTHMWKRHTFFGMVVTAVWGVTLAVILRLFIGDNWWITSIYVVGVCLVLALFWFGNPEKKALGNVELASQKTNLSDVSKTESAPTVRTLVTEPLLRAWLKMWSFSAVTIIVLVGAGYVFAEEEPLKFAVPGVWTVSVLSGTFVGQAIRASFENNLALGGTRKQWVNHYYVTSLLNPLFMATLMVGAWLVGELVTSGIIALMMCFALWMPILYCLLEFMEKRGARWIAVPFLVAAILLGIAAATGTVGALSCVVLSLLAYIWFYFYLHAIRHRLNTNNGGISQYLGITKN